MGGKSHLKLNTGSSPIAHKYCEGKVKRTLERGLKVPEIAEREACVYQRGTVRGSLSDSNGLRVSSPSSPGPEASEQSLPATVGRRRPAFHVNGVEIGPPSADGENSHAPT